MIGRPWPNAGAGPVIAEGKTIMGRFGTGRMVMTPGAQAACARAGTLPISLSERHVSGDWGEVGTDSVLLNEEAIRTCTDNVMSVYTLCTGEAVWVFTYLEADPALAELPDYHYTTVLLPDEY